MKIINYLIRRIKRMFKKHSVEEQQIINNCSILLPKHYVLKLLELLPNPNSLSIRCRLDGSPKKISFPENIYNQNIQTVINISKVVANEDKNSRQKIVAIEILISTLPNIKITIPIILKKLQYTVLGFNTEITTCAYDFTNLGIKIISDEDWDKITMFSIAQKNVLTQLNNGEY